MLATYCQDELGLYKESGYDLAFAKVETLKERQVKFDSHKDQRKKNLTETEEWADKLYSNYVNSSGNKGYRFAQPLFYRIVYIRDGTFAGSSNTNGPAIWSSEGQALSMK